MTLYKRRELPGNVRIHTARLRKEKEKKTALPKWLESVPVTERILRVYSLYLARTSLSEIVSKEQISIAQIYKDIGRAREMRRLLFQSELEHMLMEQVEARKQIIQEARRALEELRAGVFEQPGAEGQVTITVVSPDHKRIRAEADLLRVISENEKAIEELYGLRDGRQKAEGELPGEPMESPVKLVIDARVMTEETAERTTTVKEVIQRRSVRGDD